MAETEHPGVIAAISPTQLSSMIIAIPTRA